MSGARARLESAFRAALAAVDAGCAVRRAITRDGDVLRIDGRAVPSGARLVVLAAGKAAVPMLRAVEEVAGDRIATGLAVTKDGHGGEPGTRVAVRETAHPVPDARCERAARELLDVARATAPSDVLLVLLSGGASSLLACPQAGLTLDDVARATAVLLAAGADVAELNTVRKHLVDVAGGRLARAAGAGRIYVLVVSDVLGDPLDVIASGPCAPDPTTFADALAVIERRALRAELPLRVYAHLEAGARGARGESPKPGDAAFARVQARIVARLADALDAAERALRADGVRVIRVAEALRGEARVAGRRLAALAGAVRGGDRPTCLVAGGETTVTVRGAGRGGRNQELALAAAIAWAGARDRAVLAAGTDGSDGPTDAAGAFADGETVARGAARGVDAAACLAENDAYRFFAREGGLVRTGPTGTNVMDLALVGIALGGEPHRTFPNASKSV